MNKKTYPELAQLARVLSRGINTPMSGALVPTNAEYLRAWSKRLWLMSTGKSVTASLNEKKGRRGQPSKKHLYRAVAEDAIELRLRGIGETGVDMGANASARRALNIKMFGTYAHARLRSVSIPRLIKGISGHVDKILDGFDEKRYQEDATAEPRQTYPHAHVELVREHLKQRRKGKLLNK